MRSRVPFALLLHAIVWSACAYDYSRVPRVPAADAARPFDGGSSPFRCDPILQSCGAMLHCGLASDPSGMLAARCVIRGTGVASAPCDGPEDCALGYYCWSTGGGSASCRSFCSDASPSCADGRRCASEQTLFSIGAHVGHPCL